MKKLSKLRLIANLLVVIMVVTSFGMVSAQEDQLADVINYYPYNSWAKEIGEKYDLIFLENNTRECKRYEIAKILYYILDLKPTKSNVEFTDLETIDSELKQIINSVAEVKIITGYGNGEFKPNNNVTRAEFVSMIDRAGILTSKDKKVGVNFSDIQNHWAKESIMTVTNTGIINGKGKNLFCPDDSITPQEILVIIDRMVNINAITSEILVSTMKNTFSCKQYTKEEQYLVEVIYSKYDEVQNFMKYAFPFKQHYDYANDYELVTYEDIHKVSYYMMSKNKIVYNSGETKTIFDNMGKSVLLEKRSKENYYTIMDLLHILLDLEESSGLSGRGYKSVYSENVKINYSNSNEFTEEQQIVFKSFLGSNINNLLEDNNMYFPLNIPVTKYIFNYFIMNMYYSYWSYDLSGILRDFEGVIPQIEIDSAKLPYNYYEYPYIIQGVPKQLYEQPYFNYNSDYTPLECYGQFAAEMTDLSWSSYMSYYNTILNVDYRTIDKQTFKSGISWITAYVSDEDIDEYIQYVKDNEIILEGQGIIIPGTQLLQKGFWHAKAIVKFKVVSAKNMENLLFGDLYGSLEQNVQYTQKEYELYPVVQIATIPYYIEGKIINYYKIMYQTLLEGIKGDYGDYKLP